MVRLFISGEQNIICATQFINCPDLLAQDHSTKRDFLGGIVGDIKLQQEDCESTEISQNTVVCFTINQVGAWAWGVNVA